MTTETTRRGTLVDAGVGNLGHTSYRWSRCVTCDSLYPHIHGLPRCNGRNIGDCPWCSERDSPVNAYVRGDHFHRV